ncbi:phenylpyruvate tautomerase MIF-related protein [Geitlerinema sp. PCC 9228]|jgi:phenylpyruvate tautomerase PptA (4-oxalocrotonate tautomerase family)|uniref:phenylpyruvate tautomerase MIF-related protein n=1 Tax=Geitlerinema sp. PCC 9228 TaxID=111611 RepID=UPI0008F9CBD6|nr:phenylpyruvate tautomerase MIF-related protein [Geitlerinema sp. PCC 9228]
MPLLKVQTSAQVGDRAKVEAMLKELSSSLASHIGKPESFVMTSFEDEVPMTFAGTTDPACYLEVKSVGSMKPDQTQAMSQDFCDRVENQLGVAKNRVYIEFADAQGYMWGWNGSTLG